jgi:hypothetical protein
VYAVQPGVARVLAPSGPDARVQVGDYVYWHITPTVTTGESVTPFVTVLGRVMSGYGHMAFSELGAGGAYVNPLRPEGSVLKPYTDHAAPVISRPTVSEDGQVIVSAYDPQTLIRKTTYFTPVLAPAALAYRLYDSHGVPVTPLEWAFAEPSSFRSLSARSSMRRARRLPASRASPPARCACLTGATGSPTGWRRRCRPRSRRGATG